MKTVKYWDKVQGWVKIGRRWCAVYMNGVTFCGRLFGARLFAGMTGGVTGYTDPYPGRLPEGATVKRDAFQWVVSARPPRSWRCKDCVAYLDGKPVSKEVVKRWDILSGAGKRGADELA